MFETTFKSDRDENNESFCQVRVLEKGGCFVGPFQIHVLRRRDPGGLYLSKLLAMSDYIYKIDVAGDRSVVCGDDAYSVDVRIISNQAGSINVSPCHLLGTRRPWVLPFVAILHGLGGVKFDLQDQQRSGSLPETHEHRHGDYWMHKLVCQLYHVFIPQGEVMAVLTLHHEKQFSLR